MVLSRHAATCAARVAVLVALAMQVRKSFGLAAGPKLELSCGGCSKEHPLSGMTATATVKFEDGAQQPEWIRLDRCDNVWDNTFYNDFWPRWAKTADGSFDFSWLHGTPPNSGSELTVVASGWSHRYNGTQLTENSTNASVYFSFDYWNSVALLEVEDTGPGAVTLRGKPGKGVNETASDRANWADVCNFNAFAVDTSGKYKPQLNFVYQPDMHQTSEKCEISLAFSKPEIWFYGVDGIRQGLNQQVSSAGGDWDHPCQHPTAIVIPFFNGSLPPLPAGFAGPIHITKPLQTPHQFCIIHPNLTVFSSAQIKIPICPEVGLEIPTVPRFATVLAPNWMTIVPKENTTVPTYAAATLNSSKSVPPGTGPAAGNSEARKQLTFESTRWETYNDAVRLYLMFAEEHAGKTSPIHVLLHDTLDELEVVEKDPKLWQVLQLELVQTPDLRPILALGHSKMITSVTWSSAGLFYNGSAADGDYSFLETYSKLGFNTVPGHPLSNVNTPWDAPPPPWVHPLGMLDEEFAYPSNRTASNGWSGLQFGPELSGFPRVYSMAHLPLNASLLPVQFVVDEAEEMRKWERAKNFTLSAQGGQSMVDLAYDGAFLKADIADFCAAVNASRPEWIFVDDESWPGFFGWNQYAQFSANAQARRLATETDFDLSWRMVTEFLFQWSDCLKELPTSSGGRTMVGFYGTTFEPGQFQPAGFVGMPSTYDAMKDLKVFASEIRNYRREMLSVENDDGLGPPGQLTEKRQLLPWLTACTWGQMTAADVFAGTLHNYAGGASGFAFFADNCFDDPGKILALSTASALVAPHEELFFEGRSVSAPDDLRWSESQGNVLAAAGMRKNLTVWLAVTPKLPAMRTMLTLRLPSNHAGTQLHVCEKLSGASSTVTVGADGDTMLTLSAPASTVVLHLHTAATVCDATELWWPKQSTSWSRMKHDDVQISSANPELCGVNNEWVNPLGLFVSVNRDAQGHPGGWLPPKINSWVNSSDPFNSPALNELLEGLQFGNYRYPGGSIGNDWDWHRQAMSPLANDSFHQTIAQVLDASGLHVGVQFFDAMLQRAGARNILSLDVTSEHDKSVPSLVVGQIGIDRASRFEIGNEVYDPRQGPRPNGYLTAQEYLKDTAELINAVHEVGANAGVTVGPCPFFYPEGSPCWGGPTGRYHRWNRNISDACQQTSDGACPFEAVIAHNYVTDVSVLKGYASDEMLSVYLAVPQVTIDYGAATMSRDFADGIRLWITEFNTMYADVWNGKADQTAPDAAAFLNSTENSGAHAVHVASYIIAAMAHPVVEVMNYHSFLEGVGPTSLGPGSDGGSQPGFAIAGINGSGSYISPVAQILSLLARMLATPGATMHGLPQAKGSPTMAITLEKAGLGTVTPFCIHAAAVCSATKDNDKILAVNRCNHTASLSLAPACGRGSDGMSKWSAIVVYNATVGPAGKDWKQTAGASQAWGPMVSISQPGGTGAPQLSPFALSVIELS